MKKCDYPSIISIKYYAAVPEIPFCLSKTLCHLVKNMKSGLPASKPGERPMENNL